MTRKNLEPVTDDLTPTTIKLIEAIKREDIDAQTGYLVGLDRPALLAPDPAALMAAGRPGDILVTGHRWRVVTHQLWLDLLSLGRERPEQPVLVVNVVDLQEWLGGDTGLSDLDQNGWRGNQGAAYVLPITWS
jgi:hypothetical protein